MRHYIFIFALLFSTSNLNKIESKKTKKEPQCDKETCKTGKSNEIIHIHTYIRLKNNTIYKNIITNMS